MTSDVPADIPEDLYESLLNATLSAMIKHGYASLTVRDIDAEWDRSRQLINYYFDGKDHLLSTVLIDLLEHAAASIEPTTAEDPETRLRDIVAMGLKGPDVHREEYWQVLTAVYEIQGQAHHHPEFQSVLTELSDSYIDEIQGVIETGIAEGTFRDVDARLFAIAIDDMITAAHCKRIYLGEVKSPDRTHRFIDRYVIDELLRGDAVDQRQ